MKYVFKKFDYNFPKIFLLEKERLSEALGESVVIEHIGSTAIPELGGKGIIDIALGAEIKEFQKISRILKKIGYEFKPNAGVRKRLFFLLEKSNKARKKQIYHIHLTNIKGKEWNRMIKFRDYLLTHPLAVKAYADIKKKAAEESNQDKDVYMKLKEPIIKEILIKALKT
ncbi:hypothetical protein A3A76_04755 [Candidatus Woesebacteria bacterium RIFCSPLOWO2_01_FULL_39_23]|uniref:Glutamate-rich protein grpb n=2 Tax=Microgenomates group TaxID=1794810 RepID=A0A0H4T3H6_9BACT|nr:glutamate-rich protein grpb [uncultured Microgenomates bacterium Rifle_16ft_4_minimus_37633]OGM13794.1 MAG: hypothetical protein A2141_03980 [Candidatus Woesebacteria bacterium RBG_16_40_11]OGM27744.1 MAG: hypothetical protein A2628_04975 [Candidatus Woesebacteria bacterium RIFCSPHIGHO2_01_FULL_40_22]OGM36010.1 MAG: hypothetical protein A3E41_01230 [Candidatus Woesebacteria bacterium RIFCSPHIGHO2_12_FULL_38_9]OGM62166.1 MAG: hypothetical protein A3A76_04755 [Candidatus Woesebacteria bacteriu